MGSLRDDDPPAGELLMNTNGYCASCKHPKHEGDCERCGCTRYRDRREIVEARQRLWVVSAEFFVRNRWIAREVKVRAIGQGGAAMKGLREAKQLVLKPRTRIAQVRLTLTPVPRRKGEPR